MGIPHYFYNIYKQYNRGEDGSLLIDEHNLKRKLPSYLFFDYNSMIHPCAQKTLLRIGDQENISNDEIEECIVEDCILYTRYVISMLQPKYVYIMIDGVAPRAKITQQRERRYKSYFFAQKETDETELKAKWNTNKITPGTKFMDTLKKRIESFIEQYKQVSECQIVLSCSNEKGEGEHKMMKIIKDLSINDYNDKICIYGLDADLIMLSLLSKHSNSIILVRDNTHNDTLSEAQKIFTYLDVSNLSNAIMRDLIRQIKTNDAVCSKQLVQDYVFLCFLLGNDFLHHIPSLTVKENGTHMLIKAYSKSITKGKTSLVKKDKLEQGLFEECIDWDFLVDIFKELANVEDYYFLNMAREHKLNTIDQVPNVTFVNKDYVKYKEGDGNYKMRYYRFYGIENVNDSCFEYIKGLLWVLGYYNGHCHNNWTWSYGSDNTPFVSDLYTFMMNHQKDKYVFLKKCIQDSYSLKASRCLTPLEQLFLVLPRDSLYEILSEIDANFTEKVKRVLNNQSLATIKAFPKQLVIDVANKEYLWQSTVLFDKFDESILQMIILL